MRRRTTSLLLDVVMLLVFTALMVWRLTGVPIHEWAATSLIAILVVHLLIHWHWVESRIAQLRNGSWRTRVNVFLNFALFAAMGAALVSGFIISKVMFPNTLTPQDYLRWHGVHELAANLTLIVLGLHIALNWDLITRGVRSAIRGRPASATVTSAAARPRKPIEVSVLIRRLAYIAAAALVITIGTRAVASALPTETKVLMTLPGGHRELRAPPPEITRLQRGGPSPDRFIAAYFVRAAMLGIAAVVGRKVLRLRLA